MGGQTLRYADGPATPIDPNIPAHLLSRQLTRTVNGHTDSYNAMARELVELRERLERLEPLGASPSEPDTQDSDGEAPTLGAVPDPEAETEAEAEPAASE